MQRRMFVTKGNEAAEYWRKFHNELVISTFYEIQILLWLSNERGYDEMDM